jgi:hypothetical protein
MQLEKDQRPGAKSQALSDIAAANLKSGRTLPAASDTVRCTRCRRPLRAQLSRERELGPVCCQAVMAA